MENYEYTYSYYGALDSEAAAREEEERQEQERRARERREANHRLNVYIEVKKRKKREWEKVAPVLTVMAACGAAFMLAMVFMLVQRAAYTGSESQLAAAKTEYYEIKASNINKEALIFNTIDVNEIYRMATEDYNRHYPKKNQVIYYSVEEKECVVSDESIP